MTFSISSRQPIHTGVLARRGDRPAEIPYAVRFLDGDDRDELVAFRERIFAGLPDIDAYVPEAPEFVDWHLGERGVTLGVVAEGRLIGCAVLGVPQQGMPNFADDLPAGSVPAAKVAHMASSMVDPAFRGNGLQKDLVAYRTLLAAGMGRTHLLTRIAFSNPVSLGNMLACGFLIRQILVMHGSRLRYLLHRSLADEPPRFGEETVILPVAAVEPQREALAAGYLGHGTTRSPDGEISVVYSLPMRNAAVRGSSAA
jgi:GNAT superfamily N-acetyltransferase